MVWGVAVTVALTVLIAAALTRVGPLDHPRPRGAHGWATATTGGLAVIAATLAGVLVFAIVDRPPAGLGLAPWVLAAAALVGLLGALDDVLDFSPYIKLAAQLVLAIGFCLITGAWVEILPLAPGLELNIGPVVGLLGSILWLIVMMNAYNFMDGSDGLAIGVQSIGLFALSLVNPDRPILAFALLAAAVANIVLLPFNHPARRLFQGDCGALFSSFLIAGASLLLATGPNPRATLYLGAFVAAPFLTDVLLTLLARARAGRRLFQAHNEHLYQRWLRSEGRSPGELAWRVWALTALCAAIGFTVERLNAAWSLPVLVLLVGALAALWVAMDRRVGPIEPAPASLSPSG